MKLLAKVLIPFVGIGLSGCVADRAIYTDYGDLACGGVQVFEGDFWPSVVNFDFDKRTLERGELMKLNKALQVLKKHPNVNVAVVGSADVMGQVKYNKALAKSRADVVADYFIKNGISVDRMVVLGIGTQGTLIKSQNKAVNRVNRRTHLILLDADFNPVSVRYNPSVINSSAK